MKRSSDAPDHAVLKQAAYWYAQLQGDADAALRADWQSWYAQHDSHRLAWQYVERIGMRFSPLQDDRDTAQQTLSAARRLKHSRRKVLLGLATFAGGALLARLGWAPARQSLLAWRADQRTAVGEIRPIDLADGTRLWLNSDSALDIAYTAQRRMLRLIQGEVLIETARDGRPFLVETAHGSLQPLGTRFSIGQQADQTRLDVFEGQVAIRLGNGNEIATVVPAGRQRRFDAAQLAPEEAASSGRQSWSRGILQADERPLGDVITELARHHHGHIGVAPEIADLRVMGTFPLNDLPQSLSMLQSVLPISVERPLPWWISLEARR